MTQYARLTQDKLAVEAIFDLSAQNFAAQGEWKQSFLRLYVIDAQPVPSATQVLDVPVVVIGPVEAHQTWALRDKTPDELEAAALDTEKTQLQAYIDDLNVQLAIDNAARALLTNVQRINELEKDTRSTMRAVKFLLRQAKRNT
jgi:hypothetical protein